MNVGYAETLAYLASLACFGIQPGLGRLAEVLKRLGSPHRRVPAVHIGGTNGKGSTSAFAATIAQLAANQVSVRDGKPVSVGLYTSPHLHQVTERIRFSQDGRLQPCPQSLFVTVVAQVRSAAEAEPAVVLTFFEVLTAAAFVVFAQQQVTLAVVEVGLGGRLDATQLCAAEVSVVTSIGWDHTEWLGPTLGDIAREKAGIFRPGVPAVAWVTADEARHVVAEQALAVGAPLWLGPDRGQKEARPLPLLAPGLVAELPLSGRHQACNATLAVFALSHVQGPLRAFLQDETLCREGLLRTRWPGRIERIVPKSGAPGLDREIVLDAAHNPEGAEALAVWLQEEPQRRTTVLFGAVVGKQVHRMTAPCLLAAQTFLCCPPTPRGLGATDLAQAIGFGSVIDDRDWRLAFEAASRQVGPGERLLVYGSIFLVGAVRALLLDEPTDELPVQDPGTPARITRQV